MSLVLIGGHDRMYQEYIQIGKAKGHKIKVFTQLPLELGINMVEYYSQKCILTAV